MKKIKILTLLICSFLACNAYAAESTCVLFSLFGEELSASEMIGRGLLVKTHIECADRYTPGLDEPRDETNKFPRAVKDVYQFNVSSSDGAALRLEIRTTDKRTIINISKIRELKRYAVSAYDYAGCVDYVLSGGERFKDVDDEGEFSFKPVVHNARHDINMKSGRTNYCKDAILYAGNNINCVANGIELKNTIIAALNVTRLEVMPGLGVNPIIHSIFITSTESSSSHYKQKPSYRASLIDGTIDANSADISVYRFAEIYLNFASIVAGNLEVS